MDPVPNEILKEKPLSTHKRLLLIIGVVVVFILFGFVALFGKSLRSQVYYMSSYSPEPTTSSYVNSAYPNSSTVPTMSDSPSISPEISPYASPLVTPSRVPTPTPCTEFYILGLQNQLNSLMKQYSDTSEEYKDVFSENNALTNKYYDLLEQISDQRNEDEKQSLISQSEIVLDDLQKILPDYQQAITELNAVSDKMRNVEKHLDACGVQTDAPSPQPG